jgi:hypothetical protein
MKSLVALSCGLLLTFAGCVQQIAVSTVGSIVDDGYSALTEEQDLELAAQALPANLKLIEVMLKNDPDNAQLLRLASEGYSSYALGFVEDDAPERARLLYLRARDYAFRILRQDDKLASSLEGPLDQLRAEVAKKSKGDVPALFWAAFGWGSYINLSLTDPHAIADLPRTEILMDAVADKDSTFYYGGADVFLGTLYGGRPRLLGGDPDRSKRHFERALRINGGKFLMTYIYYARSYAVQQQDEALFEQLLATVEQASLDVSPEARLANAIAKRKAQLLMAKKSELF